MDTALIGIVGVLLGGALNVLGGYLLGRRRERRELRTVARLLLPELIENRAQLEWTARDYGWHPDEFGTRRWQKYEIQLATALGREWNQLASVYTAFMLLNDERELREDGDRPFEDDREYVELIAINTDDAIQFMGRIGGLLPGALKLP